VNIWSPFFVFGDIEIYIPVVAPLTKEILIFVKVTGVKCQDRACKLKVSKI